MTEAPPAKALNPLDLMFQSSGVVLAVLLILVVASFAVWLIWFLKALQVRRLRAAQQQFEEAAVRARGAYELEAVARQYASAPGARVVFELLRRRDQPNLSAELLMSVAKRAIVNEQQRASTLMPLLSSIASASPFVGLFGTVWGIMNAFLQIGVHKSASLPVVAPAIGEALIATAFGLVAAIPATIGYNFVDQKITDLLAEVEASSESLVETLAADPRLAAAPQGQPSHPSHRQAQRGV
jgi:biopolymer transport protein TolQ